ALAASWQDKQSSVCLPLSMALLPDDVISALCSPEGWTEWQSVHPTPARKCSLSWVWLCSPVCSWHFTHVAEASLDERFFIETIVPLAPSVSTCLVASP